MTDIHEIEIDDDEPWILLLPGRKGAVLQTGNMEYPDILATLTHCTHNFMAEYRDEMKKGSKEDKDCMYG